MLILLCRAVEVLGYAGALATVYCWLFQRGWWSAR